MLDVHRLHVLRTVVDVGSVTAAAQRLAYSPSAVSQQLAALEREAGLPLFERVGRGIRPTPAGRMLAEHAADVLARLDDAEHALRALRDGATGQLRLAAFPTAGAGLVPVAVKEFRRRCPGVHVDVVVVEPDDAVAALRAGRCDVAVLTSPEAATEAAAKPAQSAPTDPALRGITVTHLIDDPFRVVLPRAHRLAGRRRLDLRELRDEPWVAVTSCPAACQQETFAAFDAAGYAPRYAVEADDYPAAQGYVAAGLGVALVPLLGLGAVHDGTVVRRLRDPEPVRRVCAATLGSAAGPTLVLVETLRTAAAEARRATARP